MLKSGLAGRPNNAILKFFFSFLSLFKHFHVPITWRAFSKCLWLVEGDWLMWPLALSFLLASHEASRIALRSIESELCVTHPQHDSTVCSRSWLLVISYCFLATITRSTSYWFRVIDDARFSFVFFRFFFRWHVFMRILFLYSLVGWE